jgi:hypothetical protein
VLPLWPGPASNGEFVPFAPSRHDLWVEHVALARAAEAADRSGVDRRQFLQSAAGVAAVLATFNACSGRGPSGAARSSSTTTAGAGGAFTTPPPEEVEACAEALSSTSDFIFDVHTHHVVPDGPWREHAPRIADMIRGLVPADCMDADPYRCLDRAAYLHDLFLASDTTVALLSDVPNSGPLDAPVPFEAKRETRLLADALTKGGEERVLLHDVIAPNFGELPMRLEEMERTVDTGSVAAFKVYTAWGPDGQGFALDDPAIGLPVIDKARELGVHIMCGHKGLPLIGFDRSHNGPADMVAVAAQYPDMQFVVYHSAFERQTREGPYDPARAATGVNSLVKALDDHGIAPNSNVWAELGTTWREVLRDPDQAAHTLGKLLRFVGEDRVLWGTDAIWLGSPQPQIMAFRAFDISVEYQDRFGYPALTAELKRKVFGLNAARLFRLDPEATRCAVDAGSLASHRAEHAALVADGAIGEPWRARGPVTRREVLAWLGSLRAPWTP